MPCVTSDNLSLAKVALLALHSCNCETVTKGRRGGPAVGTSTYRAVPRMGEGRGERGGAALLPACLRLPIDFAVCFPKHDSLALSLALTVVANN